MCIGQWVSVAGTTAAAEGGGAVGGDDIGEQAREALRRIQLALEQAGARLEDVVRTRMFVTDISRWQEVGRAHGEVFGEIRPAVTRPSCPGGSTAAAAGAERPPSRRPGCCGPRRGVERLSSVGLAAPHGVAGAVDDRYQRWRRTALLVPPQSADELVVRSVRRHRHHGSLLVDRGPAPVWPERVTDLNVSQDLIT